MLRVLVFSYFSISWLLKNLLLIFSHISFWVSESSCVLGLVWFTYLLFFCSCLPPTGEAWGTGLLHLFTPLFIKLVSFWIHFYLLCCEYESQSTNSALKEILNQHSYELWPYGPVFHWELNFSPCWGSPHKELSTDSGPSPAVCCQHLREWQLFSVERSKALSGKGYSAPPNWNPFLYFAFIIPRNKNYLLLFHTSPRDSCLLLSSLVT